MSDKKGGGTLRGGVLEWVLEGVLEWVLEWVLEGVLEGVLEDKERRLFFGGFLIAFINSTLLLLEDEEEDEEGNEDGFALCDVRELGNLLCFVLVFPLTHLIVAFPNLRRVRNNIRILFIRPLSRPNIKRTTKTMKAMIKAMTTTTTINLVASASTG